MIDKRTLVKRKLESLMAAELLLRQREVSENYRQEIKEEILAMFDDLERKLKLHESATIVEDLLELAEEQHQLVTELLELLAIGQQVAPEAAREARQRQARIARKLARIHRNLASQKEATQSDQGGSSSDPQR